MITAINKQPVIDNNSLRNLVASMAPGSNATVTVQRNGRDQNFQVALAELPDRPRTESEESSSSNGGTGNEKFGLTLQPLTAENGSTLWTRCRRSGTAGYESRSIGSAANAGIRQGDLIQEVNRQPVRTLRSSTLRFSSQAPSRRSCWSRDATT